MKKSSLSFERGSQIIGKIPEKLKKKIQPIARNYETIGTTINLESHLYSQVTCNIQNSKRELALKFQEDCFFLSHPYPKKNAKSFKGVAHDPLLKKKKKLLVCMRMRLCMCVKKKLIQFY